MSIQRLSRKCLRADNSKNENYCFKKFSLVHGCQIGYHRNMYIALFIMRLFYSITDKQTTRCMQQNRYHKPTQPREMDPAVSFGGYHVQELLCGSLVTNNKDNKLSMSRELCSYTFLHAFSTCQTSKRQPHPIIHKEILLYV